MNRYLVQRVAILRETLAEREAALAFVQSHLPEHLVAQVEEYTVRKQEGALRVIAGDSALRDLQELMLLFPLSTEPHYLATHTGVPVPRTATSSLTFCEAARPVHPAWLSESDVLGSSVNWMSQVGDLTLHVSLVGLAAVKAARELLWLGYESLTNVKGRTLWRKQIARPKTAPLPASMTPQAALEKAVQFLNRLLEEETPRRRGLAPSEVLEYLVQKHMGWVAIEVSPRHYTWTGSLPDRPFSVSVKDSKGHWWHELDKVRQVYRQGKLDDGLWYDLIPACHMVPTV